MLSPDTQDRLESFLRRLKNQGGGPEIQILTVENLGGVSIEEAAIKTADAWGPGNKRDDNGVLFMVSKAERKVRIEVGMGLQGDLPDITASRIVREVVIPSFKNNDIDRGVTSGVLAIVHYTNPQFLDGQNKAPQATGARKHGKRFDWVFLLMFFLVFILPLMTGRRRRSGLGGFVLGYGLGRIGGGGGGFGSGSGGWGGGGGGFNGGGSSGSW